MNKTTHTYNCLEFFSGLHISIPTTFSDLGGGSYHKSRSLLSPLRGENVEGRKEGREEKYVESYSVTSITITSILLLLFLFFPLLLLLYY